MRAGCSCDLERVAVVGLRQKQVLSIALGAYTEHQAGSCGEEGRAVRFVLSSALAGLLLQILFQEPQSGPECCPGLVSLGLSR